jgi:hypothetical protein
VLKLQLTDSAAAQMRLYCPFAVGRQFAVAIADQGCSVRM